MDLAISGKTAWHAARRVIEEWQNRSRLSYGAWRAYPADVYRAKVLGLSNDCMDRVRNMQWWRHFQVGDTFFSVSYSRGRASRFVDFRQTTLRKRELFTSLLGPAIAVAPYRLKVRPESPRSVKGVASSCWFLRQGLGRVSGAVRAPVVMINERPWLWLDGPGAFSLLRA